MSQHKGVRFWEDTSGSPWIMYFSWDHEADDYKYRSISNMPPSSVDTEEGAILYAIRVSEFTKEQIDKFGIAFTEDKEPYLYLRDGETYEYPTETDRRIAEAKRQLESLEEQKQRDAALHRDPASGLNKD